VKRFIYKGKQLICSYELPTTVLYWYLISLVVQ